MAKKILAGCLAAVVLTSLAWYAGFLHSDRQAEREQSELWQELQSLSERVALQEDRKSAEQPEEGGGLCGPGWGGIRAGKPRLLSCGRRRTRHDLPD